GSNERRTKTAFDTNKDGKSDQWQIFAPSGAVKKVEFDTNFDGKPDRWDTYKDGKVKKVELDRNFDGKVDMTQNK
ncbi:MAG: hypothetical protein ACE5ER_01470, partial [Nitrospinaceae bacterium]